MIKKEKKYTFERKKETRPRRTRRFKERQKEKVVKDWLKNNRATQNEINNRLFHEARKAHRELLKQQKQSVDTQ